jgi:hypothetical protein
MTETAVEINIEQFDICAPCLFFLRGIVFSLGALGTGYVLFLLFSRWLLLVYECMPLVGLRHYLLFGD